jgi:hypothetical protein
MNSQSPNNNQYDSNRSVVSSDRISRVEEKSIIRKRYDFAVSGWIATFLGFYLFSTGAYSLVRLITVTDSGDSILKIFPEFIDDSSVATDKLSMLVLVSYIAGMPMFAGSALMAIGSLARNTSRLSSARTEKVAEWIIRCDTIQQLFSEVLKVLTTYNIPLSEISDNPSNYQSNTAYINIRDLNSNTLATCIKNTDTGDWHVRVLIK